MSELADEFLDPPGRHLKPRTPETDERAIHKEILPIFGHLTVNAVTPELVKPKLMVWMRMPPPDGIATCQVGSCRARSPDQHTLTLGARPAAAAGQLTQGLGLRRLARRHLPSAQTQGALCPCPALTHRVRRSAKPRTEVREQVHSILEIGPNCPCPSSPFFASC